MTSEDFNLEATAIANRFLGMQSTTINEAFIKAAFQQLIYRFYETGGYLLDRLYQPILDVEDVEIFVDRHGYKVSIVIDRKALHRGARSVGKGFASRWAVYFVENMP